MKIEFEQLKPKNQYQKYLDELLGKIKIPFIEIIDFCSYLHNAYNL